MAIKIERRKGTIILVAVFIPAKTINNAAINNIIFKILSVFISLNLDKSLLHEEANLDVASIITQFFDGEPLLKVTPSKVTF